MVNRNYPAKTGGIDVVMERRDFLIFAEARL
jgi:Holliday junction resolvase-like predicted endonuclease